jgi:hypothetical protein
MGEWAASPSLYQPWLTVVIKVLIAAQGTAERAAREAEAAEVKTCRRVERGINLSHKSWSSLSSSTAARRLMVERRWVFDSRGLWRWRLHWWL